MKLNTICTTLIVLCLSFWKTDAQNAIGSWSDHLSYYNCSNVFTSDKWVYGISPSGIIRVNEESGEVVKLSKVNLLTSNDISAFLPLGNGDEFFVGYSNGSIDLYMNQKLYNIPDIKERIISGSKKINRFKLIGNYIYVATDFGVVVVDYLKKEIKDTWKLGEENSNIVCNNVILHDGFFFVATSLGIYTAPESSNALTYYGSWSVMPDASKECVAIDIFGDKPIAVIKPSSGSYSLHKYESGSWIQMAVIGEKYKNTHIGSSEIAIVSNASIRFFNSALSNYLTKTNSYNFGGSETATANFTSVAVSKTGSHYWISDSSLGLIKQLTTGTNEKYTPSGPLTNNCQKLEHSGSYLFVAPGTQTTGVDKGWYTGQMYFYNGTWTNYSAGNTDILKGVYDIYNVSVDPNDPKKAYFSSWGNGYFETNDGQIIAHYNNTNTVLKTINAGDPNYVWVGDALPDKKGNLFVTNAKCLPGLLAKSGDKYYGYDYGTFNDDSRPNDMLIDNNGYVWTFFKKFSPGIFVFDTNKTVDNPSDDRYRGPYTNFQDDDSRNYGQLLLIDQDGSNVSSDIFCLAVDKNGYLWVGTDKGPLVNYRPWAVFSEEVPTFNRIKIPRNDEANLADYLLEAEVISSIVVDGANRKWLGTRNSGAFLVSEDGTKTILSFTESNSPLPSNNIRSITINPTNGEIFFGTDKGIVSYQSNAIEGLPQFKNVYAFPNPVRPEYKGKITIKGLMADSNVKITDVNGNLVYETQSLGGLAIWDGRNLWGKEVTSGIYLVFVADPTGQSSEVTKILIVR